MSPSLIFMLVAIIVVGVALLIIIAKTRGRGGLLDQQKYREAWLKIENNLDKSNLATFQFAVLSADKLLDQALKESGIKGEKMADRLKNAKEKFSNVNQIWAAHKLRNVIAHEPDAKVNLLGAKRALATFKKALKELGAI
ncbi:hypothetical protein FWG95_04445 [Candidatus Saccharibacteria bacterium]|nr:hypothetical protein [Candidatus Saccharibacteria bacterium]